MQYGTVLNQLITINTRQGLAGCRVIFSPCFRGKLLIASRALEIKFKAVKNI